MSDIRYLNCYAVQCDETVTVNLSDVLWHVNSVGVFHNHNPSNLDSSDQRICLFCDLNLNLDYESVDLPLEVDQHIQCPWITHNSL